MTNPSKKGTKKRRRIKQHPTPSTSRANNDSHGELVQYEEDNHHHGIGVVTASDPHQTDLDDKLSDENYEILKMYDSG